MSKYHYIITAKKRSKENNEDKETKTVTIGGVTEFKENHKGIYSL